MLMISRMFFFFAHYSVMSCCFWLYLLLTPGVYSMHNIRKEKWFTFYFTYYKYTQSDVATLSSQNSLNINSVINMNASF